VESFHYGNDAKRQLWKQHWSFRKLLRK